MEKFLTNKNVIITGTAKGIGHTMLKVFAEKGANVIAHARNHTIEHEEYIRSISEKYGVWVEPCYFDLTVEKEIKAAIKDIRDKKCKIDGLVNNAGIGSNTLFQMTTMDVVRKVFEANFFGPFLFTQYVSKFMVRQGVGSIINISSTSALDGNSGKSVYGASKAAIIALTKSIAEELGRNGVRCNAICPGVVNTASIKIMPDYIIDIERNATYLNKLADKEDIANVATYLVSDYSSYITGQVIRVDGGKTVYEKMK